MGGDQRNKADFLFRDDIQNFLGPKRSRRMKIHGSPDIEKREREKRGIDMAQRHDIHADVMMIKAEINGIDQIKCDMGFMRPDNTFGFAGCSGCIDQNPGIGWQNRNIRFCCCCVK